MVTVELTHRTFTIIVILPQAEADILTLRPPIMTLILTTLPLEIIMPTDKARDIQTGSRVLEMIPLLTREVAVGRLERSEQ